MEAERKERERTQRETERQTAQVVTKERGEGKDDEARE